MRPASVWGLIASLPSVASALNCFSRAVGPLPLTSVLSSQSRFFCPSPPRFSSSSCCSRASPLTLHLFISLAPPSFDLALLLLLCSFGLIRCHTRIWLPARSLRLIPGLRMAFFTAILLLRCDCARHFTSALLLQMAFIIIAVQRGYIGLGGFAREPCSDRTDSRWRLSSSLACYFSSPGYRTSLLAIFSSSTLCPGTTRPLWVIAHILGAIRVSFGCAAFHESWRLVFGSAGSHLRFSACSCSCLCAYGGSLLGPLFLPCCCASGRAT